MRRLISRLAFFPSLVWNMLLTRVLASRRWWDRVDDFVILGALPFPWLVTGLLGEGVRAVVNTCDEYGGPVRQYDSAGIVQLRVPTIDFSTPSLVNVERAVAFIQEHVAKGETVYVHCKAGRGRSATVLLCWLIDARGMTPEEAQQFLLEKRPHVKRRLFRRHVVQEFARRRR